MKTRFWSLPLSFLSALLLLAVFGVLLRTGARAQATVEPGPGAAPGASGGPDAFGYVYSDSLTTPALYHWVDIAAGGSLIGFDDPDTAAQPLDLPGGFSFYGREYTRLYATTNGYASFQPLAAGDVLTQCDPAARRPPDALAAFCADLWGDTVYYSTTTSYNGHQTLILQYDSVTHTVSGLTVTFQIILDFADDAIIYQYRAAPAAARAAAIGIVGYAANQEDDLVYCQAAAGCPPQPGLAVRFATPPRPALMVALLPANDFPAQGDTVAYTLVMYNTGRGPAPGAVMRNTLPVGLDYVADSAAATAGTVTPPGAARTLQWDGDLPPGEAVTVTYLARLLTAAPLYNTAVLTHPLALTEAGSTSTPADIWGAPEPIDTPHVFSNAFGSRRYLAVDSRGTAHAAYAGDQLYYAVYSDTAWVPMVVPITPTNLSLAALALDDQDQPHIAFKAGGPDATLWVAHGTAAAGGLLWSAEKVATLSGFAFDVDTLDLQWASDGSLHLAFNYQNALYYLHTAHAAASGWTLPVEVIGAAACSLRANASFNGFSLALDPNHTPHVACVYNGGAPRELRLYAASAQAPWIDYQVVHQGSGSYDLPSLRFAGAAPHIAFFIGNHDLYHAQRTSAWQVTLVDHIAELNLQTAAVLDVGGERVGIAYAKRAIGAPYTTTVRSAARGLAGGAWATTVVTTATHEAPKVTGALGAEAEHIVAFLETQVNLLHSAHEAGAFALQTIDESRALRDAAVVVAADGAAHVAYLSGGLRYARLITPTVTWERSLVDQDADVDFGTRIDAALDQGGALHVGYFSAAGELMHAAYSGGSWRTERVDSPNAGYEKVVSVGAEAAETAHFAYSARVGGNHVLRHAALDNENWAVETLTTLGPEALSGVAPRLVAQDGKVYILYLDCTRYQASGDYPINLQLLTWDGGWSTRTLYRFAGRCGFSVSVGLVGDAAGQVMALADITSESVRPTPLRLEHWVAGGDGSLRVTRGQAAGGADVAAALGTMTIYQPTMLRGSGIETFGTTASHEKYAVYSTGGRQSHAVTVGSTSGATELRDGARSGEYAALVERAYGGQPGLYMEYVTPNRRRCCLRTEVAPGLAADAGASAAPPYIEGPCSQQVTVSAQEPDAGWRFTHWSGAASGAQKITLGTLSGQIPHCSIATANFEPIPEATGAKSAQPAAPQAVYPGQRITYTLNLSWREPLNEALIKITDPYPWPRATLLPETLAWGNYIPKPNGCAHDAQQHQVNCAGQFPASAEGVSTWVRFATQAACGLYAEPGPVTNRATIQVGSFQFAPQARTEIKVPFRLMASSPGFVPRDAFTGAGERPNSTVLLYTVPKGDEPNCCTNCGLDVYVVVDGDMSAAHKMTNDGAGAANRAQADFVQGDCHHSAWFRPTEDRAYKLDLYVVTAGGQLQDAHLADTLLLEPASRPELVVLTDLRELFNEFHRVTPNSPAADSDNDCVRDYYEALDRLRAYAAAHKGLLFDVRQDAYYADLAYTADEDRHAAYMGVDWLISRLPNARLKHLAIIGDDAVLPFYRYDDPQPGNESRYLAGHSHNLPALKDTHQNMILTDVPYSVRALTNDKAPMPSFNLGRIFADTPLKLVAMVDGYETDLVIGAQRGSAFTFSLENELTPGGRVKFDWQGNTRSSAITPLTDAGYTLPTVDLAQRGVPQRRGWFDAEAGVVWDETQVVSALNSGGGNRLTIINAHASHLDQSTATASHDIFAAHIAGVPQFPGSLVVNIGCHAGYTTGFDPTAALSYYRLGLVNAALDRHMTWFGSTTFGDTTSGPDLRFHDRVHEQFLRQALGTARTIGDARRLALRAYTTYHNVKSFKPRDETSVYGTALYGLPTQQITRSVAAAGIQAQPMLAWMAPDRDAGGAAVLDISLSAGAFVTRLDADGATWFAVADAEEYTALDDGPVVPLLVQRIVLPAGSSAVQVTLVASDTVPYAGQVALPLQRAGNKTFGVETAPYTGTTPYPDPLFWTTVYTDSGATELVISAVPLRYDPLAGAVTLVHRMDFRVQYTAPAGGAALSGLAVGADNTLRLGQPTVALRATAVAAQGGAYTLRWWVEDAAGRPVGGGASGVNLGAGGNALTWQADSGLWPAGAKILHVTLVDGDDAVVGGAAQRFTVIKESARYLPLIFRAP